MNELRSWIILAWRLLHYIPYKMGLIKELPRLYDIFPETMDVLGRILGWHKYLRVRSVENCLQSGPIVFSGNHMQWDDAWIMFRAVYLATHGLHARFMMRDDFFSGSRLLQNRFFDVNELTAMGGTYHVHRDNVTLSQLKPFVKLLTDGESFIMYPGRTRTRSGLFVEYREDNAEPGSVSFFIAQAQRRNPDTRVAAVPITRTLNPVNNRSTIILGDPQYIEPGADRAAQRAFDFALMERLGDLVEVNAAHLLGGVIYLYCLHDRGGCVPISELESRVAAARDRITARYISAEAVSQLGAEIRCALAHFQARSMLQLSGDRVELNRDAILSAPEPDREYKEKNPVKFLVNQIVHLPDVVAAIEDAALS
ncbi:MAG: hypothetical protein HZB26_20870 [Candidatus Hydrogenedentes bacterium]|nr:hypothetical protein [Candidatus Hydrogenedentota bacterium]